MYKLYAIRAICLGIFLLCVFSVKGLAQCPIEAGFNFSSNNTNPPCASEAIQFNASPSRVGLIYEWSFGDNETSTARDPLHTFRALGQGSTPRVYEVILIVTDTVNNCMDSDTMEVAIKEIPEIILRDNFGNPINEFANCGEASASDPSLTISFNDDSQVGGNPLYEVNWGDGDIYQANAPPNGHTYNQLGIYTISYKVTQANGCENFRTFRVLNISNPQLGLEFKGNSVDCEPLTLEFTIDGFSGNDPSTLYIVDPGDGSDEITFNHPPPSTFTYTYTKTSCPEPDGIFTFSIRASNGCEPSILRIPSIKVFNRPQANFELDNNLNCVGNSVRFINLTEGGFGKTDCAEGARYIWDYGDGTIDTVLNTASQTHIYNSADTYTIKLTAENSCGPTVFEQTVEICEGRPRSSFRIGSIPTSSGDCNNDIVEVSLPGSDCAPLTLSLNDNSVPNGNCPNSYRWSVSHSGSGYSFSNGSFTSNETNEAITFTSGGVYTIIQEVTNTCGTESSCLRVLVKDPPPTPSILGLENPTFCNTDTLVLSTNTDALVDTYDWSIQGPANRSFDNTEQVSLPLSGLPEGTYQVFLTATNACGDATDSLSFEILPPPNASITPSGSLNICVGDSILLSAPEGSDLRYQWIKDGTEIDTTRSVYASEAGLYQVIVSRGSCNSTSAGVQVSVLEAQAIEIRTEDSTRFCANQAISALLEVLNAPDSLDYRWQLDGNDLATGATYTATQIGTYRLILREGSCESISNAITIDTISLPDISFATNTLPFCNVNEELNLPAASPTEGFWQGPGLVDSLAGTFNPVNAGGVGDYRYFYTYTDGATGCSNTDSIEISIENPTVASAGVDTVFCQNDLPYPLNGTPNGGIWTIVINGQEEALNDPIFDPMRYASDTYTLIYTVGQGSCENRDSIQIAVLTPPLVDAGPDLSVCVDTTAFVLQAQSLQSGGTFIWDGDGVSPEGLFDPEIAGIGSKVLTYTFTDTTTNCSETDSLVIRVNPVPSPAFQVDSVYCIGEEIVFINQTPLISEHSVSYRWIFGDGNIQTTGEDGINTYNTPGTYAVTLEAQAIPGGCIDRHIDTILVVEPPRASFVADSSLSNAPFCGPITLNFQSTSQGTNLSYEWDFGNGIQSIEQNPDSITFLPAVTQDTTYNITLTITQNGISGGCTRDSETRSITVKPIPTARFLPALDPTCSNFPLILDNFSTGNPDYFVWDYGDGSPLDTTDEMGPREHVYVYEGATDTTYTTKLYAINECGTDTLEREIWVLPKQINALFRAEPDTMGCAPFRVSFESNQSGLNRLNWFFDNESTVPDSLMITQTYNEPGVYNVTLVVQNGCDLDTFSRQITVFESPQADFDLSTETLCLNEALALSNQSSTTFGSTWNLGDGSTVQVENPAPKFYDSTGVYTISLTVTDPDTRCTDTITKMVEVIDTPEADFSTSSPICEGDPVTFTHNTPDATTFQWRFGASEGGSIEPNPSYTYAQAGAYQVELITENAQGCRDTLIKSIEVAPKPVSAFSPSAEFNCGFPAQLTLSNQSTGAIRFEWRVEGELQGDSRDITLDFDSAGVYEITLTAFSELGCSAISSFEYRVLDVPRVEIVIDSGVVCVGERIIFSNASQNATEYLWDFGDGTTSGVFEPAHIYENPGEYRVILTAFNQGECEQQNVQEVLIRVNPRPEASFTYRCLEDPEFFGVVEFSNTSAGAVRYLWSFGDGDSSTVANPSHRYPRAGTFTATLITENELGCFSEPFTEEIELKFFSGLHVPNAFMPGNAQADVSCFKPKGVNLREYSLKIFDTWGNVVWESTALDENGSPAECWDGADFAQGVYVWKIEAIFLDGTPWQGQNLKNHHGSKRRGGMVTLIR